jgi:hypothetical protein
MSDNSEHLIYFGLLQAFTVALLRLISYLDQVWFFTHPGPNAVAVAYSIINFSRSNSSEGAVITHGDVGKIFKMQSTSQIGNVLEKIGHNF